MQSDGRLQPCPDCEILRSQLASRDEALARLTNRLLTLERGQAGDEADRRAVAAEERAAATGAELHRLRSTRTFRWTDRARWVWGRILAAQQRR